LGTDHDICAAENPRESKGEQRFLLLGKIGVKHWSAVVTYWEGRIRLISVRRSRKQEVEFYEG